MQVFEVACGGSSLRWWMFALVAIQQALSVLDDGRNPKTVVGRVAVVRSNEIKQPTLEHTVV